MKIKVADEVWLATALLHYEQPTRGSFSPAEIVERARQEGLADTHRPGVPVHVYLHCVANKPRNPGNHRMLFAMPDGSRRLFREGDDYDPSREGGKTHPVLADLPGNYHYLVEWYLKKYSQSSMQKALADLEARMILKFEQKLPVLRRTYEEADKEEILALREWLEKLVAVEDPPQSIRMRVLIEVDRTFYADDGEGYGEGTVQFSPGVIFRALQAWEKGEFFTPGLFGTI